MQELQKASEVAGTRAAAQEPGTVRRDLEPGNLMLTRSRARLPDGRAAETYASEGT